MTVVLWVSGVLLLAAAAALPVLAAGRRGRSRHDAQALDQARDRLSRLDAVLDGPGGTARQRSTAQRCRLLAGAALAGRPDEADAARALRWARAGLTALGVRDRS